MNDMVDGFCLLLAAGGLFGAFVFARLYRREREARGRLESVLRYSRLWLTF